MHLKMEYSPKLPLEIKNDLYIKIQNKNRVRQEI